MALVLLSALFLLAPPSILFAVTITENDIAPTLFAAVKDATGLDPEFPIPADHEFFRQVSLDITGKSVTSLKGIVYFTELTSLTADQNRITTLRGIVFPENIRRLSLAHNHIAELNQAVWPTQLRTLDLRNNRLTTPLETAFPEGVTSISFANNFLTSKLVGAPRGCTVNFAGNFIYEANAIRPASLVIRDLASVSLNPGEQRAIPFVSITSSTNPNNQVPPRLLTAQVAGDAASPVQLTREEYRFLLAAQQAGSDYLIVSVALSPFQLSQYERMNQTFYQSSIPITVWQSAENRPGATSSHNGDAAVLAALSGLSTNAVSDMTRFPDNRATFSPGLLAQLANQDQRLILSHEFGNLTLDPHNLKALADQAAVSVNATVQISFSAHELRQTGVTPSRFSDKQVHILPYSDYTFSIQLRVPGERPEDMDLVSPVSAVLYLMNQRFTAWDLNHLTAFKDNGDSLDLLGGVYSASNVTFSYLINGTGRFGLGTRSTPVRWLDLAINSSQITRWDGTVEIINPAPLIHRGSTIVPMRSVFEEMGASVTWREPTRTAAISYGAKTIHITEERVISGSTLAPYVINGRMLVPLRFITTEFGATVIWWSQNGRIRIVY